MKAPDNIKEDVALAKALVDQLNACMTRLENKGTYPIVKYSSLYPNILIFQITASIE